MRLRYATLALVAFAAAGPATAQDIGGSGFSWTGFYAGINGGGGLFSSTTTDFSGYIQSGVDGAFPRTGMGELVGGTAGVNVQVGDAVIGIEGDLAWSSFDNSASWNGGDIVDRPRWDWFGTVRARAGVALDRGMVYATAGALAANTHYFFGSLANAQYGYTAAAEGVVLGLAAGGGVEYALTDHMTAKFEYLYLGLPTTHAFDGTVLPSPIDFQSSAQIVRVGLNYKF
ncbi:MAG: porin family protein [Devosia nanyangense]|uniref:Porin family protein n=1 Tax=Devosia nanyangense TaxID=1228055 RepID=A0A933NYB3_9HYPH|nr:porin family protein [Devosia nanyangense]